jgi:hypothetical protein
MIAMVYHLAESRRRRQHGQFAVGRVVAEKIRFVVNFAVVLTDHSQAASPSELRQLNGRLRQICCCVSVANDCQCGIPRMAECGPLLQPVDQPHGKRRSAAKREHYQVRIRLID